MNTTSTTMLMIIFHYLFFSHQRDGELPPKPKSDLRRSTIATENSYNDEDDDDDDTKIKVRDDEVKTNNDFSIRDPQKSSEDPLARPAPSHGFPLKKSLDGITGTSS